RLPIRPHGSRANRDRRYRRPPRKAATPAHHLPDRLFHLGRNPGPHQSRHPTRREGTRGSRFRPPQTARPQGTSTLQPAGDPGKLSDRGGYPLQRPSDPPEVRTRTRRSRRGIPAIPPRIPGRPVAREIRYDIQSRRIFETDTIIVVMRITVTLDPDVA